MNATHRVLTLLLASLLASCATTRTEDLPDHVEREICAFQVPRDKYTSYAEAARDTKVHVEAVHEKYGLRVHPVNQLILSYAVALGVRVDRGEIPPHEAQELGVKLDREVQYQRRTRTPQGLIEWLRTWLLTEQRGPVVCIATRKSISDPPEIECN